jgi:predicted O-methyltransferase YrrM
VRGAVDAKMNKVLDAYHRRIEEETAAMRQRVPPTAVPPSAGDDWRNQRLLAVGPETGQLINTLVRSLKAPNILELGTSFGYSAIWLADAARATGGRVTTMELHEHKSSYARERSTAAGLAEYVEFRIGDSVSLIQALPFKLDFVLVDLWKDLYVPCLEAFYPKLNPGAIVVADNITRPGGEDVLNYVRAIRALPKIDSLLLPVGSGLEISRYDASPV